MISLKFFQFFVIKTLELDPGSNLDLYWDLDPDPQLEKAGSGSGSAFSKDFLTCDRKIRVK
jgi:hypothetical protein